MEDIRTTWFIKSSKVDSQGFTEIEGASTGSVLTHLLYAIAVSFGVCKTPNSESGCITNSFACS